MSTVNRVILIGNLGHDPDAKLLPDGKPVTKISIATSEKSKGVTITEWHNITFFGNVAKVAAQYLKKGAKVYVEGKIRTNTWKGKDGTDKKGTEIIGSSMQMLGSKADNTNVSYAAEPYTGIAKVTSVNPVNQEEKDDINDDDVPF